MAFVSIWSSSVSLIGKIILVDSTGRHWSSSMTGRPRILRYFRLKQNVQSGASHQYWKTTSTLRISMYSPSFVWCSLRLVPSTSGTRGNGTTRFATTIVGRTEPLKVETPAFWWRGEHHSVSNDDGSFERVFQRSFHLFSFCRSADTPTSSPRRSYDEKAIIPSSPHIIRVSGAVRCRQCIKPWEKVWYTPWFLHPTRRIVLIGIPPRWKASAAGRIEPPMMPCLEPWPAVL